MLENKVVNYSIINLNTATLLQDGKTTNSVYPFMDLESALDFMSEIVSAFKSKEVRRTIASKYYILVDKDCKRYSFDIDVTGKNLVLYECFNPIAYTKLKGDSKC